MVHKICIIFIASMFLISCESTKKISEKMDSWLGHHKSELIESWGPPTRYESDGKGGEILIYERSVTQGSMIGKTYYENTNHPYRMFYADRRGKIYHWRTGS